MESGAAVVSFFFFFINVCKYVIQGVSSLFCCIIVQLLDLPGIIEGAKDGKGRGRQVRVWRGREGGGRSQENLNRN